MKSTNQVLKMSNLMPLLFCLASLSYSCKRQDSSNQDYLIGRWKLAEVYDEFGAGAVHAWRKVPDGTDRHIEFLADRQYKQKDSTANIFQQCSGTYQRTAQNNIEITSTCEPGLVSLTISESGKDILITDQRGTEGMIRYKYIRDN